jgi:type II secretory ATPase GspE/PulE/Tfp pilus assembly ATPase PilB-like protein
MFENIVIRILKDPEHVLDLKNLGFNDAMRETFESLIRSSFGMILETGPTGSGKTTTLYAALSRINSVERNIITVEDPVEYKLPMIRQIQINPKANLTFANALRSILRQDPDIIMIGEIRDKETAEIAVHSAMTGHLVFSTLHTNTACGAITRLADMGIEPFLISSSVVGVLSQRLVRRLCDSCKEPAAPSEVLLKALRVREGEIKKVYTPKGCRVCRNMGYKGRTAIYELLKISEPVQKKITHGCDILEIEEEARKAGFKNLLEDGLEKVRAGVTTLEEVLKAVNVG